MICKLCEQYHHSTTMGELYSRSPVVQRAIDLHLAGAVCYEQALIAALIHLVDANERLMIRLEGGNVEVGLDNIEGGE